MMLAWPDVLHAHVAAAIQAVLMSDPVLGALLLLCRHIPPVTVLGVIWTRDTASTSRHAFTHSYVLLYHLSNSR